MGRVTLIRHAYGVPPSPRGRQEIGCVSRYLITENILIYKSFQITKNIKPLPSPRGKVPTSSCGGRRMRVDRVTASSVRQQTYKLQFSHFLNITLSLLNILVSTTANTPAVTRLAATVKMICIGS